MVYVWTKDKNIWLNKRRLNEFLHLR
jgi:hypothetical protein